MIVNNSVLSGKRGQPPAKYFGAQILDKEFTAYLTGIGKAVPPFDNETLKTIRRTNASLHARLKRIDSAYELTQNETKYYFAGLNSINYDKFNNCSPEKPCKIKCSAIIFHLTGKSSQERILILKSFSFE